MKRIWLTFAQSVTACLGLLFVLRVFYPHLLETGKEAIVIRQVESNAAPSNTKTGFSAAAKKAMPSVVNIFTFSKVTAPNPNDQF